MVSIDKLRERFVVRDVPPYGLCVIVPREQFVGAWESEVRDQGHNCIFTDMADKAVVLVKVARRPGRPPKGEPRKIEGKKIIVLAPAGPEPPTPEPSPVSRVNVSITVDIPVDCSNPKSIEIVRKILKAMAC